MAYMPPPASLVAPQFKEWVVKKIGVPLLQEADWAQAALPNPKFGAFNDGTGSIARETTNFYWGGSGSCKMLTDAVIGHSSEVKASIGSILQPGELLAFEMKWVQQFGFGNTQIHMGIESRDITNIIHSRFRWTPQIGVWQMENPDTTYSDFPASVGGPLAITKPTVNTAAGSIVAWCRSVVDPWNKMFVSFEAAGSSTKLEVRDLRPLGLPLVKEGTSGGNPIYLFFVLVQTQTNNAEPAYTTDWCVSKIPAGISPF